MSQESFNNDGIDLVLTEKAEENVIIVEKSLNHMQEMDGMKKQIETLVEVIQELVMPYLMPKYSHEKSMGKRFALKKSRELLCNEVLKDIINANAKLERIPDPVYINILNSAICQLESQEKNQK